MHSARRWFISLCLSFLVGLPASVRAESNSSDSTPFPVPAGLESAVEFWKKVFTEFSRAQMIFFDPLDLSNIYEVMEVGEDNRSNDFINAERARVAAELGVDIERVKTQRGIKERTAAGIKSSGRYLDQVKKIFTERGLPPEIVYLPIVESSYDINARSSVGALGIWQFMPRTGRQYLRIARGIDERRDPLEASRAAATYLKEAYDSLGSWPLAITSYNFGPAGMARAVAAVESEDLVELIQKYEHPYWGFAPKNFYAEFLAAVEIGSNVGRYFPGLELDAPVEIKEVEVQRGTALATLVKSSGLKHEEFLGWNPALSRGIRVVPAGYRFKVPADKAAEPLVVVAVAVNQNPKPKAQRQVVHHRVKRGETLYEIARRYGASVRSIVQVNNIRHAHRLRIGTTLRIPRI